MTAAIVGVAESDLGLTGKSRFALQAEAVVKALAEAGLTLADVDGYATAGVARMSGAAMVEYLGIVPTWLSSTMEGGSSFEFHVAAAADAIAAGRCEVAVVAHGSDQRSASSRKLGGVVESHTPLAMYETPYGPLWPLSAYALSAQRYFHEYGAGPEDLAEVAVAAREWARLNPKAYRYDAGPLTVEDVLSSPTISAPLHALDCCLVVDGGGAVVLTSLERARDLREDPIALLGAGSATDHFSGGAMANLTSTEARRSAAAAFGEAGVTPADIDVTEVYDSFTITVLLTLEALGYCGPGEAKDLIADGAIRPGGTLPLNTNGGGLSYCHPGMYGILLIVEAVRQLRGEAGDRQVAGAELAVAHGTGGVFSSHGTLVLGVDR